MILAVTGGTGFVGARFLDLAEDGAKAVKALTRRLQEPRPAIDWVPGSLEDRDSLRHLLEGADAVVHIAGVINTRDPADFERGNVEGTAAVIEAAASAGVKRFVHVSSLAAREPQLSLYGASKARSEELVRESSLASAIVRPPAVYGPGDRETLELFRMAKLRLMLLPPAGRVSLIHVDDLSRLLLALADPNAPTGGLYEPDDGRPGGWTHKDLAAAIGEAVGKRSLSLSMPPAMLRLGAVVDQLVRRERAKLSADRAAYFSHRDWAVNPKKRPPAKLWQPEIDTREGLAETAAWYRSQGWL
jgi:nucleoside-diphosphate-sugar epimerase